MTMKTLSNHQLSQILKFTIDLSQDAGKKLLIFQKKISQLKVSHKMAQGVVSLADLKTEEMIFKKINKKYPDHDIMGEEESFKLHKSSQDFENYKYKKLLWVIDPLDGTHNFLNGSDYFCVSIALVQYGKPLVGVVYRPVTHELFFATKTEGAFYQGYLSNNKIIKLSLEKNSKKISDSIFVTGFASEKGIKLKEEFELFELVMSNARGVRRFGSAALDLCYVAFGMWDGFFEKNLSPWDVAAAGLILEQSGAKVTDYSGTKFHPFQSSIMGLRSPLYKKLLKIFKNSPISD